MKKVNILLCILLTASLLTASCKKSKPGTALTELEKLPPITQTGANTFGCLVDGVAWLPNGSKPQTGGSNIVADIDPTFQTGLFRIDGLKYQEGAGNFISINTYDCTGPGVYSFSSSLSVQYFKRISNLMCEMSTTTTNTYKTGNLIINRYDAINRIYSGTFEFKLYNSQSLCGDTIRITNGRFDVKL